MWPLREKGMLESYIVSGGSAGVFSMEKSEAKNLITQSV
jgi:hypothetical protein